MLPAFNQDACPHADPALTPWSSIYNAGVDLSGSVITISAGRALGRLCAVNGR